MIQSSFLSALIGQSPDAGLYRPSFFRGTPRGQRRQRLHTGGPHGALSHADRKLHNAQIASRQRPGDTLNCSK